MHGNPDASTAWCRKDRHASRSRSCPPSVLKKPEWIRIKLGAGMKWERFNEIKESRASTVAYRVRRGFLLTSMSASGKGTATFHDQLGGHLHPPLPSSATSATPDPLANANEPG